MQLWLLWRSVAFNEPVLYVPEVISGGNSALCYIYSSNFARNIEVATCSKLEQCKDVSRRINCCFLLLLLRIVIAFTFSRV
jgi:hypothetical protein